MLTLPRDIDRQTGRWTDRDRQAEGRQVSRHRQTERQEDKIDRQTDRQTETDRQR